MEPKAWPEAQETEEEADQTESAEGSPRRRLKGLSHSHQPEADILEPT